MDVSENQSSPMSLEGGNLNIEEQSKLHVQFPKELRIADERKNKHCKCHKQFR